MKVAEFHPWGAGYFRVKGAARRRLMIAHALGWLSAAASPSKKRNALRRAIHSTTTAVTTPDERCTVRWTLTPSRRSVAVTQGLLNKLVAGGPGYGSGYCYPTAAMPSQRPEPANSGPSKARLRFPIADTPVEADRGSMVRSWLHLIRLSGSLIFTREFNPNRDTLRRQIVQLH